MNHISRLVGARDWMYLMMPPGDGSLVIERTSGRGLSSLRGTTVPPGEGIFGRAVQRRQALVSDGGAGERSVESLPARGRGGVSTVAVPLLSRGRALGVMALLDRSGPRRFTPADAQLVALLLEPVAVALDSAILLKRSEELSVTDDLTKLYNSRYLNVALRREVERGRRYGAPVSLIFLDLDGFKDVNDRHGHLCGSRTLVEVGQVLKATVREVDIVARFGGDEFTIVLPETGPEGACIIAERIRERIAATPYLESQGLHVRITASLGIASFPAQGQSGDDLIALADQAMYRAKAAGKNGVRVAREASPGKPLQATVA